MNATDSESENFLPVLTHAALSDVGLRRANNQDALAVVLAPNEEGWRRRGHLFLVADGMGAHAAGELASKLAAETVPHLYAKSRTDSPAEAIGQAIVDANTRIHEQGEANSDFHGMGTTCSTLLLLPEGAIVAHVGDSRVYRLRGDHLEQLTADHSLYWEVSAAAQARDASVPDYVPKNIITRSLGPKPTVEVDLEGPFPLLKGDLFLLCSDGLTGPVTDEEMAALLRCLPPAEAVQSLVDLANLKGGPDNITVVIAQVGEVDTELSPTAEGDSASPAISQRGWIWLTGSLAVLLGLLAVVAWYLSYKNLALIAFLVDIFAWASTVSQYMTQTPSGSSPDMRERWGEGPYRHVDARPTAQLAKRFAEIAAQVREAAHEEHHDRDWQDCHRWHAAAEQAYQRGKFQDAVREYARIISCVMAHVREKGSS